MIVEIYSYENRIRSVDKKEYTSLDAWEKDLFVLKLSGTHVGYKRYDEMDMLQFDALTLTQKNNLDCISEFDKDAWISQQNSVIKMIHSRMPAHKRRLI